MLKNVSENAGGGYQNVLVIGADALSQYVDWSDRGTCILFGDAAGAVLLQVCQESLSLNSAFSLGFFFPPLSC